MFFCFLLSKLPSYLVCIQYEKVSYVYVNLAGKDIERNPE